jgi:predicted enzyme related to lactoylglutathione lyase
MLAMSERDSYPAGVPCWVETLQRDRHAAQQFYGSLFGWQIVASEEDAYAVARLRDRDVAGIGVLTDPSLPEAWYTNVSVEKLDDAVRTAQAAGATVLHAAIEAEPAGRLAVISDPQGAVLCLWEAECREGAQVINEPGAWAMSALQTADVDAALAFYGSVFGWQAEPFGPATLFRLPGFIGGTPTQPVPRDVVAVAIPDGSGPPRWGVDFWVADTDATAARAVALGGSVIQGPFDRPPFRGAVLADGAGAAFSISQLVES